MASKSAAKFRRRGFVQKLVGQIPWEMRYRPDAFSDHDGRYRSFAHLTLPLSQAKLHSVFSPRWISRKASSGVLFFWGGEYAS